MCSLSYFSLQDRPSLSLSLFVLKPPIPSEVNSVVTWKESQISFKMLTPPRLSKYLKGHTSVITTTLLVEMLNIDIVIFKWAGFYIFEPQDSEKVPMKFPIVQHTNLTM